MAKIGLAISWLVLTFTLVFMKVDPPAERNYYRIEKINGVMKVVYVDVNKKTKREATIEEVQNMIKLDLVNGGCK